MGAARAPEAHVPRRTPRGEDGPRLLRVRREREEGTGGAVDPPDLARTDAAKAALWGAIAGLSLLALVALPSALLPPFYYLAVAAGYALILPLLAVLHARHQRVRESGAVLGTIAGTATVVMGMVAAVDPVNGTAALFVRGIWWWTIGKMWWETSVMPRPLGLVTMVLAPAALAASLAPVFTITWLDAALGLWTLALSFALARSRTSDAG